ncbi:DnaD domain protein [Paenibacillaceae bacterium]|nr:DnaD domain protein [Paenibacillaceae bacterium]
MMAAMNDGIVAVPGMLLRTNRQLGLSMVDTMLLLQLAAFRQTEQNDFPTPEQLGERLGLSSQEVGGLLRHLMKKGFIEIDEQLDPLTGVQSERYNWQGWLYKAAALTAAAKAAEHQAVVAAKEAAASGQSASVQRGAAAAEGTLSQGKSSGSNNGAAVPDLFSLFEQEFGRPLSPMEFESIGAWIDQDGYADELIRFALKEAVFAGKLHFRYIDRILLEWSRNRITNIDEARSHTQKFRGG